MLEEFPIKFNNKYKKVTTPVGIDYLKKTIVRDLENKKENCPIEQLLILFFLAKKDQTFKQYRQCSVVEYGVQVERTWQN